MEHIREVLKRVINDLNEVLESLPKEKVKKEKQVEEVKQPTLEEVRTVLAELSRKGYTTNVRMILIGFGVSKLSEVDPKDYPELLAKAKELEDATKD
ncbi:MAG: hypothetical protein J6M95_01015 [Bacilli bacterium]|nr:hypothetical protein [Bacilli bacterium]